MTYQHDTEPKPGTPRPIFGKDPVVPPRVVHDVPRIPDTLLARFEGVAVADVADLVGAPYVMSAVVRPLFSPMKPVVGRALTVKAWPGDNLAIHGGLALATEGDVLVVDWRGYVDGCGSGSQSLVPPFSRGLRGVVVDGGWRDVKELEELGFPVFARAVSPWSPPKERPGEINVTVSCGGVIVEPGDIVLADEEGVCVVPRAFAATVAEHLSQPQGAAPDLAAQVLGAAHRTASFRWQFDVQAGVTSAWGEEPSGAPVTGS